ncbi:MAG: penicillin acylase family protein, partial [Chloroflexi bacterium]|nr:penicillin acylase family protein [Chloroflexota bacterium]
MTQTHARTGFQAALPRMDGEVTVSGLDAPVVIRRDASGIAHVRATTEHDAWFGQGYACAQDRLWQMEYDRRRARGRWAEVAGSAALKADILARRMQLARAARADVQAMSETTRAMFAAYAAGVNAFLSSGQPLPAEFALTGVTPEPWAPWHSVAGFKVRHVLMGLWQRKLVRARLLATIGPELYAQLEGEAVDTAALILPSSGTARLIEEANEDIQAAAGHLGFLAELDAGSNSWAVHGSRTTTGMPVLCNDSHRQLDVPNVYWQAHLSCPEFNVIGATFPGVPGFPHFGHNGSVAWNITHTSADYQDLYIEEFDTTNPGRHRTADGWADAELVVETVEVADAAPVQVELWRTHHGPIVHGDPRKGSALALKYTATDGPCRGFEPIRPMLSARTVPELHETQREWVDPVNNLVSADTAGNIGYLTRGAIPIRASSAARRLPAAGWTGEHEWTGLVPFEQLPRAVNPPEGFIATANQRVIAGDEPYISADFAPPWRAERITEVLSSNPSMSPTQIAALQADTTSVAARIWSRFLALSGPFDGEAERARSLLASWDANLSVDNAEALLYGHFRRRLMRALYEPLVGEQTWAWLTSAEPPALGAAVNGWITAVTSAVRDADSAIRERTPDGRLWREVLSEPLAAAWRAAVEQAGPEPSQWQWGAAHRTSAKHTLAARFPDLAESLNPP